MHVFFLGGLKVETAINLHPALKEEKHLTIEVKASIKAFTSSGL